VREERVESEQVERIRVRYVNQFEWIEGMREVEEERVGKDKAGRVGER
jgi:hypothetical protein